MIWRTAAGAEAGSRAEDSTAAALSDVKGVGLRNYTVVSGRSVREVDTIVITPAGVAIVETKGTLMRGFLTPSLNGAWTIDGVEADFKPHANPVPQARKSAQVLKSMLTDYRCEPGFVATVVCVIGPEVSCPEVKVGDIHACGQDSVAAVVEMLEEELSLADALRILAALDVVDVTEEDLLTQGFLREGAASEHTSARERRALRKRAELAEAAERMWRASNRRRVVASIFGSALSLIYLWFAWSYVATGMALIAFAIVVGTDLYRRRKLEGERSRGALAVLGWLVTVGPFAGVGAVVGLLAVTSFHYSVEAFLALQIGMLLCLALIVTTMTGKSSFIYPPPAVVERTDALGRPLGVFYLADTSPRKGRWQKVLEPKE